jgi:metal-sulfur cluster biosynthetic enzyme
MTKKQVMEVLRTVKDPELGVNIVDLGLIYKIETSNQEPDTSVHILMTLTTPGCPLGGWFVDNVTEAVAQGLALEPEQVAVKITFDPPWSQELMSSSAKAELGFD